MGGNAKRERLHDLIDMIDDSEFDLLYHLLIKFIAEDVPTSDEVEAIRIGRESFQQGNGVRHEDINWN